MKKILFPMALVLCFGCNMRVSAASMSENTMNRSLLPLWQPTWASACTFTDVTSTLAGNAQRGPIATYGGSKYYCNGAVLIEVSAAGKKNHPIQGRDFTCYSVTASAVKGNKLYLIVDNGSLGGGAGYYLLCFNMDKKSFSNRGFGRMVQFNKAKTQCIITEITGVKRGECEADNEYIYRDKKINL
jgi:hypothetical protein